MVGSAIPTEPSDASTEGFFSQIRQAMAGLAIPASAEEEAAFRRDQLQAGTWNWRLLLMCCAGLTIVWWPTDLLFFRRVPGALAAMAMARGVAVVTGFSVYFIQPRVALLRDHPYSCLAAAAAIIIGVAGYEFGCVGGPSTAWFHFAPVLTLTPVAIALRMRYRVALTAALGLCLFIGYFVLHPSHFADPMAAATMSWLVFLILFSVTAGAVADQLRRNAFRLRHATERHAEELREWSALLETRVRQQTAELRMLTAHRESTRETERAIIARELHDELGQELTAIRYALELLRLRYQSDPSSIAGNLDDVDGLVAKTRQTIRSIVTDLRPRVLDDLGLKSAAEWLALRTRERTGLPCDLQMPADDVDVPEPVSVAAFRILQEALTNVARHAKASRIRIRVLRLAGALELLIEDDGQGFEPTPRDGATSGMGLVGMRERAFSLGGTLEVVSRRGEGTKVRASLPLVEPERAP